MKHENIENDADKVSRAILDSIENNLGPNVFDAVIIKMIDTYCGNEKGVLSMIKETPELFDNALVELLGEVGEKLLATACKDVSIKLGLNENVSYSKAGDLARWMKQVMVVMPHTPRVMVVDDEQDALTVIEPFLQDEGWHIDIFADPLKALEHFTQKNKGNSHNNYYSAILSDIRMPQMSGLDLAGEFLKVRADTKILFMTAYEIDDETREKLRVIKHEEMLKKPFQIEQVCTAIKRTMSVSH